jgi:hypothetical protein
LAGDTARIVQLMAPRCSRARVRLRFFYGGFSSAARIPVRVRLTHVPGVLVSAGMTCTVAIKEGATPEIGLGFKKVMTAIFGAPSS